MGKSGDISRIILKWILPCACDVSSLSLMNCISLIAERESNQATQSSPMGILYEFQIRVCPDPW